MHWGCRIKAQKKDRTGQARPKFVVVVGGVVHSIHTLDSKPFSDKSLLWALNYFNVFHYRVLICEAEVIGKISLNYITSAIKFMWTKRWVGTIQKDNGI